MKTIAIIPAGGKGLRSGYSAPKQFLKINGKELLIYTIEIFQKNRALNEIAVAVDKTYFGLIDRLRRKYHLTKLKYIVEGGKQRQDSVFNALSSLSASGDDLIVVHDAARPLLPSSVLYNAIYTARLKDNAVVCIKAKDTLVKGTKIMHEYTDRTKIYYVQTPQIFSYKVLMNAMKKAYEEGFIGTDESMLVKRLGKKIHIVEGSAFNFKVTSGDDVIMIRKLLGLK